MGVVREEELVALTGRAREVASRLRAWARTPLNRDVLVKLRSQYRTHDRLGTAPFQPGDSVRLLILRDLVTRGQFNVRTFHAVAELTVLVVVDCSRSLLGGPQTGPFALKLAALFAMAGVDRKQPSSLAFLDGGRRYAPTPAVTRSSQLGALFRALATLEPGPTPAEEMPRLLEESLGRPRANTNLFLIVHAGVPLPTFGRMLETLRGAVRQAMVLPVVAADEFEDGGEGVIDPESGRPVAAPADRVARLIAYMDALTERGRYVGVPVEPLVVGDHRADLETLLPMLGNL